MCKSKKAVNASVPSSARTHRTRPTHSPTNSTRRPGNTQAPTQTGPSSNPTPVSYTSTSSSSGAYTSSSSASISHSSRNSLSSLRDSLPENTNIYDIGEIRAATNGFLAKRHSSPSSTTACWRCNLRGKEAIVFQRKFRRKFGKAELREKLSVICRSHHGSVIKLMGASISGEHIYLVYEFTHGATLSDCLRNPKNPSFTVLSLWMSRMQIATDLAHGLDYIHNKTGLNINLVHNHIKSNSVIVTEPSFNAKICHFGTAQLCGEIVEVVKKSEITEVDEEEEEEVGGKSRELKRSDSRIMRFEGVRGYMSPEFQSTGLATQKSDVYAFGVVILELLSGEEPLKYKFEKARGDYVRTSVIETARGAIDGGEGMDGRLRKWVDRRLRDSFPVDAAEKLVRLALDCVHVDPDKRPDMGRVAGKISTVYLRSRNWWESMKMPTEISVSLGPR